MDCTKPTQTELWANGGYNTVPHPDGKAWGTCCRSGGPKDLAAIRVFKIANGGERDTDTTCQCFMRKPPKGKSRFDSYRNNQGGSAFDHVDQLIKEKGRFFCCHRLTVDGYHRECAGWAARITHNPRIKKG